MSKFIDVTGQRFGRLVVVGLKKKSGGGQSICQCDCGRKTLARTAALRYGEIRSCGCGRMSPGKDSGLKWSGRRLDLTGQVFGRLRVIGLSDVRKRRRGQSICQCDCGRRVVVMTKSLRYGKVRSCGCYKLDISKTTGRNTTHGGSREPLYGLWCSIKRRCFNKNEQNYPNYGGRGIKMHKNWIDDYPEFRNWILRNIGPRKSGLTIDRVNNEGNYEPGNLRWATPSEQAYNRRPKRK